MDVIRRNGKIAARVRTPPLGVSWQLLETAKYNHEHSQNPEALNS